MAITSLQLCLQLCHESFSLLDHFFAFGCTLVFIIIIIMNDIKLIFPSSHGNLIPSSKLIFRGQCAVHLFIVQDIMIFGSSLRSLGTPESNVTGRGGSMDRLSCTECCGVIGTSVEAVDITGPTDNAGFL